MHIFSAKRRVIEDFMGLVDPKPATDGSTSSPVRALTLNPIRRKGLRFQDGRQHRQKNRTYKPSPRKEARYENIIHRRIEDNPFLLYTPKLYQGGLFLDSIVSKLKIFSGKVPDFIYLTVTGTSIKITLVEIECASRRVFPLNFSSSLHSDAMEGLNQVRSWKRDLDEYPEGKKEILKRLSPLFACYPIALFDHAGSPWDWVRLHIDFMLIVGRERPSAKEQDMLDQVYTKEGILMMTYPMMIDALAYESGRKNTLGFSGGVFRALVVEEPNQLLNKSDVLLPENTLMESHDDDIHGDRFCGWGVHHDLLGKSACLPHPMAMHYVLMRSGGVCEHPGCGASVLGIPGIDWEYVFVGGDTVLRWDRVALLCKEHVRYPKQGWWPIRKPFGFRAHLDSIAYARSVNRVGPYEEMASVVARSLGLPLSDCVFITPMLKKLASLPWSMRKFFADHIKADLLGYSGGICLPCEKFEAVGETLVRLGLMEKANHDDRVKYCDGVLSGAVKQRLVDHEDHFRVSQFLDSLCHANLNGIKAFTMS